MAIAESELLRAQRFLGHIRREYGAPKSFRSTTDSPTITYQSTDNRGLGKVRSIRRLILPDPLDVRDDSNAFFSEWATKICLENLLKQYNMVVNFAPPDLERPDMTRKGVDIIIAEKNADNELIPMLGIDIKLRELDSVYSTERHAFDTKLIAPAIHVSLGNWTINTREQEAVKIREWTSDVACPNILRSGKLPHLEELTKHICKRVDYTLSTYVAKTNGHITNTYIPTPEEKHLFPIFGKNFDTFYEKLLVMQTIFTNLNH